VDQSKSDQSTSQPVDSTPLPARNKAISPGLETQTSETVEGLTTLITQLQAAAQALQQHRDTLRQSHDQMAQQSQRFQALFEDCPHCLMVTDSKGVIQQLNQAALRLLDPTALTNGAMRPSPQGPVSSSRIIGQSLFAYINQEARPYLSSVLDTPAPAPDTSFPHAPPFETWITSMTGEQYWVQLAARLLHRLPGDSSQASSQISSQAPADIMWSLVDMTVCRQTELDLRGQINDIHQQYADVQQENQVLEEAVQTKNSQVLKGTEIESTLKRITDNVRDSLDESKILQTVVRELSTVLRLGGCNTALYDLEQGTSTISYEYTNFISAYRGKVAQMDHFPEIYNQLRQGRYFQFCSLVPNPERGHVALLACPIFMDTDGNSAQSGTVLGDLWLIDRKEHVFNEFEIRLVQQVANQCAIAIRQARLYEAAQSQVHELEKLNRMKDEFLSTVSHELRTPLANVKMAIHMMKNAQTDEKREQYIQILEAESEREASLINDLLDLQRLEVSSYAIAPKVLQVKPWLDHVIQSFDSRIAAHSQQLKTEYDTATLILKTDFSVLERIVAELLNNACKYTPSDHDIHVSVRQAGDRAIEFVVSNQAVIAAEELPRIFDKFYRVPNADPWKQGGTGLGLALVQRLVEQLDGTIDVRSTDGWTHFTVTIPTQGSL